MEKPSCNSPVEASETDTLQESTTRGSGSRRAKASTSSRSWESATLRMITVNGFRERKWSASWIDEA